MKEIMDGIIQHIKDNAKIKPHQYWEKTTHSGRPALCLHAKASIGDAPVTFMLLRMFYSFYTKEIVVHPINRTKFPPETPTDESGYVHISPADPELIPTLIKIIEFAEI